MNEKEKQIQRKFFALRDILASGRYRGRVQDIRIEVKNLNALWLESIKLPLSKWARVKAWFKSEFIFLKKGEQ